MVVFPERDICIVRGLAQQVMELACSDEYETRRQRWRDANERRKGNRAPVWCRPAAAWNEILPQHELECENDLCRRVEYIFRQHLYKHWIGDDHLIEPWWDVSAVWDCDSDHTWGVRIPPQVASTDLGGFRYDPPIKREEDYERITIPTFAYNAERTERNLAQMQDLLGETMPVRLTCGPPLGPQLSTYLERLRGMAGMLNDLAFHPHLIHRLMAKLTEGVLRATRVAEATGLLTTNHHEPMFCSDPVNGNQPEGKVKLHNLWVAANSQEFQEVSPRMQEEFLLHYELPILQQYGAVQYGCCEDLTHKIDLVLRIPNLRIFVCSAWTDLEQVLKKTGGRYTIMWRQPAHLVTMAADLTPIRKHLEEGLRKLQGYSYQIVLREIQSLFGHRERLREWARLAIDLAERFA
ncbi:MAG: hypothetical protein ACUVX8_18310 [Candidatus Zipacnadales bacterium]